MMEYKWGAVAIIGIFAALACVHISQSYCVSHAATVEIAKECHK